MPTLAAFITGPMLLIGSTTGLSASSIPILQTPAQLLTTVAALEAQENSLQNNSPLACAALFGAPSVKVGQQVVLAWGSIGAIQQTKDTLNEWPLDGASTLSFSTAGTFKYPFTFYSASGATTTCAAEITVTQ